MKAHLHGSGPMADRVRAHDWAPTSIGSIDRWPDRLVGAVEAMLATPLLSTLAVGPERVFLYNDEAARTYRDRHPALLGRPMASAFAPEFASVAHHYDRVFAGGSVHVADQLLDPARTGDPESFDAWLTPVWGDDGEVIAAAMIGFATGERVRAEAAQRRSDGERRAGLEQRIDAAANQVRASRELLQGTIDSSDDMIQVFEAIRDKAGEIVDFRWILNNRTSQDRYGQITGALLLERNPGVVPEGIFDAFKRVTETGVTERAERHYVHEQFDGWFYQSVVKLGDGVATTTKSIDEWKAAQADILRLQEASATARLNRSEQRFQALVTAGVSTIYRMSPDWRLMYQLDSDSLAETVEPIEGWADKYIPADDLPRVRVAIDAAIRSKSLFELEHRVMLADGSIGWVLSRAVPMLGPGGEIVEWFGTGADVTVRRQASEKLKESERRQSAILEAVPLGLGLIGADGGMILCNPAWSRYLPSGRVPSRDPDRSWRWRAWDEEGTAIKPEDFASARALRGERVVPGMEFLYTDDSGDERWTSVSAVPVTDAQGAVDGAVCVILDIDSQRRAEATLRVNEERQAFLLTLSDALRSARDADAIIATTSRMVGEWLRASRIVFAEIDEGRGVAHIREGWTADGAQLHPADLRLADFAGSMLDDLRAGRTVRFDDVGEPPFVRADCAALHAIGVQAGLSVPLLAGGNLVLNLNVHQHTPRRWTDADVGLVEDVAGRLWAALERSQAEAALRESEQRLRHFGEASQDVLWARDVETLQWTYLTPAFETIYGVSREEALNGENYRSWLDLVLPEDRAHATESIERVRGGEQVAFEFRIRRPVDGEIRWMRNTDFPIRNAAGNVVLIGGIGSDVTVLREAEQRLETLMTGIPQLVWRAVGEGQWTWASPQWTEFTGQAEEDSHGLGWLDPMHPDDHARVMEIWSHAIERGEFEADYRLLHAESGRYCWFRTRATPLRNPAGDIVEWLGTSTNIDALHELQDRQQLLLAELQHRVRNMLTVVRSVFSRTIEVDAPIEELADHFRGRLDSLARTQVVVTQSASGEVDLENLIRDELLSVGAGDGPRLAIEGPDVALPAKAAESIGLAIHELTTNALKYGALRISTGSVEIRWTTNMDQSGGRRLDLTWSEQGVPAVPLTPARSGFGTELITEALPYRLGAETSLIFRGGGVCCTISVPLPDPGASVAPAWKD